MRESQNQLWNYDFERDSAIDGSKLDHDALTRFYDAELNYQQYHSVLTPGELAAILATEKCGKR